MGLIIAIHVIICVLLIGIILIQAGRGGGLVESFSNVESMFGTKTNTFLTRTTTILSILFFLTCLSLAFLSVKQSRSLMRNIKTQEQPVETTTQTQTQTQNTQTQTQTQDTQTQAQTQTQPVKEIPKAE